MHDLWEIKKRRKIFNAFMTFTEVIPAKAGIQ